jgi:monovalent cation:proton antiporter-2 (CPA2) family protein
MDQTSFLYQALVYLTAAVLMVPLAKKAGLGSVLGYLVAGMLIGPAFLNLVGDSTDVMHAAEFGVVIMLFVIGLELEPSLLWKLRKPIVGLGGLQVLCTIGLVMLIAMAMGYDWKISLAIGMIVAPSSTAIVLQTLQEKGLMKTQAGQNSFSVLLFQDIAVIPILAILPLLGTGRGNDNSSSHGSANWIDHQPAWIQTLLVFAAVVFIIIAGRKLIRPLLRIVAAARVREVFTATSLLLVIGITVLMTQVGLSPALGTFLAGVVLADSEYRHELESDIEPFKGLLLGLFFIAIGASINFQLLTNLPVLLFGIVLGLMAIKGLILLILGKFFKLGTDQNLLFSLGLCQIGEFAFVLLTFSRQEQIISNEIADIIMAAVALSMAFTPLLFLFFERVIQPRFGTLQEPDRIPDTITEKSPVIIAGFGHFGNTVGRFLKANGIACTVLDIDSDRVDFLRKFGFNVYYGDASRYDLLHSAGAADAKVILITIDDAEKRLEMIETIKKHFPNLQMMVRSSHRYDAYDQMNAGMLHIYRETLDSSLRMGVDTMKLLGHRSYTATRAAQTFLKYDEMAVKKLSSIRDQKQYINTSREFIEELEKIIQNDSRMPDITREKGWDDDSLIKEGKDIS